MCKYCDSLSTASVTESVNVCVAEDVSLAPTIDNYNPCPSSPYAQLPPGLRQTLGDTFTAIQSGEKDAEGRRLTDQGELGLQNTFKDLRADTWDALDNIPSSIVNLYRLVYDRVMDLLPSVWDQVLWIRWSWISSSMGFNVTYRDPAAAKRSFAGSAASSNMNGRAIGFESRMLSWYFHRDCDCWRELPRSTQDAHRDPEGLHILVGDRPANPRGDSIHIDPIDPYKFRDSDGVCRVTIDRDMIEHLKQVFNGHPILSPFDVMPGLLQKVQGDMSAGFAQGMDAERAEVCAIAERWAKEERFQAALGKAGWRYVQSKVDRLNDIRQKLDRMRPAAARPGRHA
jgi:hypothetical protein